MTVVRLFPSRPVVPSVKRIGLRFVDMDSKKFGVCFCLAILLASAATWGYAQPKVPRHSGKRHPSGVAATVNGTTILQSAIDAAITPAQRDDDNARAAILQQLIAQEVLWQEVLRTGFEKRPEAVEAAKQATVQLYIKYALKLQEPTESELRQRYNSMLASLGPKEFRVSIIETRDETTLHDAQASLLQGNTFEQTAQRYSVGPTAAKGGELDWVSFQIPVAYGSTNGLPFAYAQVISQMTPGKVSQPISIDGRWALIRLDAVRPTLIPTFENVRISLRDALYAQNVQRGTYRLTHDLLNNAKITIPGQVEARRRNPPIVLETDKAK